MYRDNNLFKELNTKEEQTFRQWARDNYVPYTLIKDIWHPIVRDECVKINVEAKNNLLQKLEDDSE